ncbi:MAG: branched-chain amino acid ABC transporter permease, partial [Acidobacteriota bacterium]
MSTASIEAQAKSHPTARPGLVLVPSQWPALASIAVLLALVPFVLGNDYFLLLFNVIALNAIVVLGLNLLIGSTGQVSLGHAAFYGLGAYLSAIASTTWQWPLPYSFCFAVAFVALTAFLLALPTLRLEGHYLVMATLGFNIIVNILFGQMEALTGGPSGFPGIPKLQLGPFVLGTDRQFYFFIWSVFLLMLGLTLNLTDSRIGRALQAVHEKDLTAQALGIPSFRYKVATFVLSALYAGIAGFCYAHYVTFISPKTFDIFYSVQVVTMVAVGGMGSLWGGLAGAVLLTVLPEFLHTFEDLHVLLYGLILMSVLVFCP